jgi:hypothetical protein
MMPISLFTDACRMSKLTSGNFRDICQMIGFSTCVRVGNVNQQRLETDAMRQRPPPAIAGTIESSSPSFTGVSRFWRNRMSSSFL